jgi:hypothetical protein
LCCFFLVSSFWPLLLWLPPHLAEVLSELGRFDEAFERAEASVRIAEEANNPFTLNFGLFALGRAHFRRGDLSRARPPS